MYNIASYVLCVTWLYYIEAPGPQAPPGPKHCHNGLRARTTNAPGDAIVVGRFPTTIASPDVEPTREKGWQLATVSLCIDFRILVNSTQVGERPNITKPFRVHWFNKFGSETVHKAEVLACGAIGDVGTRLGSCHVATCLRFAHVQPKSRNGQ